MKLTQEQLAELIAKVFASISAKRKAASKEADPAPAGDDIGTDEILSAVSEILGDIGEPADPDAKADDTAGTQTDEAEISPELIARVVEALGALGAKAAAEPTQQKAAEPTGGSESKAAAPAATPAPAPQRKYASLFLGGSAAHTPNATGFKARIASMSAPERTKTVYGMFGRAVKCLHADTATGTFEAVTDERLVPNGPSEVKDLKVGDIANFDLDLLGCKHFIKITLSGDAAAAGSGDSAKTTACAVVLGDHHVQPV